MNETYYLFFLVFLLLVLVSIGCRRVMVAQRIGKRKKGKKETKFMENFAKQFMNRLCLIYIMSGSTTTLEGTIKEVQDGGMLIEDNTGKLQVVNLDYVTRIREYPTGKNGKKKSVVLD